MLAIAHGGIILDTYDKVHLVPFGEYLPYESVFRHLGLHHFVHIPGGFAPGAAHRLMDLPGLPPVVALICYEAIFPEEALPSGLPPGTEPGFIINVTNDAWFGRTAGPYQHLAQARLLTIEQGLPMLRDANTGISAIIDPYGRVLQTPRLANRRRNRWRIARKNCVAAICAGSVSCRNFGLGFKLCLLTFLLRSIV